MIRNLIWISLGILLAGLVAMHVMLPGGVHCLLGNRDVWLLEGWKCPGVVLLEIDEEGFPFVTGFGYESRDMSVKANGETRYNVASLSKQFTGFAIAILMERGLVEIDAPVSKYLGEFDKPDVTVGDLLFHTSGIPDYTFLCDGAKPMSDADVLRFALENPLEFSPGEYFEYSNTGYVLLALIVERLTGAPFPSWLERNVFGPLGMNRTSFGDEEKDVAPPWLRLERRSSCGQIHGDGGIVTTMNDYAKWLLEVRSPTLVERPTMERVLEPGRLNDGRSTNYGFGWAVTGLEIHHEGLWNGYRAVTAFDRKSKYWTAAFTNYALYDVSGMIDTY